MFYSNRGMYLESLINYTIEKYNSLEKALIFKNSQPVYFKDKKFSSSNQGTVDYHGIFLGRYLCFEAKMTQLNYLPWNNIKPHQWEFLIKANNLGAISFLLIYFVSSDKYYLILTSQLIKLKTVNQKINEEYIKKNGHEIKLAYPFLLDFIKIIEHLF